jgi:Mg2+ and Co2+ transporter CorA
VKSDTINGLNQTKDKVDVEILGEINDKIDGITKDTLGVIENETKKVVSDIDGIQDKTNNLEKEANEIINAKMVEINQQSFSKT